MCPTRVNHHSESRLFALWTALVWILFFASVFFGHLSRFGWDYLKVSWWLAGGVGVAAGILGILKRRHWLTLAVLASAILVVSSTLYWADLVERLLSQEKEKTIEIVLSRIWEMNDLGLRAGLRGGTLHWVLASLYREILMPVLQLVTLAFLGVSVIARKYYTPII